MESLPSILFGVGAKRKVSDIEYLSIKEDDGKRVDANASTTVTNTTTETAVVTQTANTGKDMYLGKAKGNLLISEASSVFDVTLRLKANGVLKGTRKFNTNAIDEEVPFEFNVIGIKVATGDVIEITVQHSIGTATTQTVTSAELILFEEDTGKTPQIPSI